MQKIPIDTAHLFPVLEEKLIALLQSLTPEEWEKQTVAAKWKVKDVAAHLLDGTVRTISLLRDQHMGDRPGNINSYEDLVGYLNGLNAQWVQAMKRMSRQLMTSLLETTGKEYCCLMAAQDPWAVAPFAVSWAGESSSVNWFHIAREYTERWHHQQQIRDAVNKPGIMDKTLYYPVLNTFMMALPYTYRNTETREDAVVQVSITGDGGGDWFLTKYKNWVLTNSNDQPVTARCVIDGDVAWKLFTRSWRPDHMRQHITLEGDEALAEKALDMIAVMA